MTIGAVQAFVEDTISGLVVPGETRPLECHILPPVPGKVKGPYAYVYVESWNERREAGPRVGELTATPNFTGKYVTYRVIIDLVAIYNPDPSKTKRWRFANYINTVTQALKGNIPTANTQKALYIPVQIFDEVTGESSWLASIGETIDGRQFPMVTLEDNRTYYAQGELTLNVEEQATG